MLGFALFVKVLWRPCLTFFLDCVLAKALWSSCLWSLNLARFSSKPISDWVLAIIFPHAKLNIPKTECRQFQLHATLVLDFIWQACDKLIHEAALPNLVQGIHQLKAILQQHCLAWKATALSSLWIPPGLGFLKGNFDVAIRGNFAVAATVISNSFGDIILAATQRLSSTDVLMG